MKKKLFTGTIFVLLLMSIFVPLTINITQLVRADALPPTIVINFAGNLTDSGGSYWSQSNETTQLTGNWSDGYYANNSQQSENFMYINVTVTDDDDSIEHVWLNWLNGTTWTNYEYEFTNRSGGYFDINTSDNFSVSGGYDYSFNVVANDSDGNSNYVTWSKMGLGETETRRYVQLNSTTTNISYKPLYIHEATPSKTLYERYTDHDANAGAIQGMWWYAQQFTVGNTGTNEDFPVSSVKLPLTQYSVIQPPGNGTVAIYDVDNDGKPNNSLCSINYSFNNLPEYDYDTNDDVVWTEFVFTSNPILRASTQYAIVVSAPGSHVEDPNNTSLIQWMHNSFSSAYTGGYYGYSYALAGSARYWFMFDVYDLAFEVYSTSDHYNSTRLSYDRLNHDQGLGTTDYSAGYLRSDSLTDDVTFLRGNASNSTVGAWYDNDTCIAPINISNIYYHVWYSANDSNLSALGWENNNRTYLSNNITDSSVILEDNNRSSITYNNLLSNYSSTYLLTTNRLNVTSTNYTDNSIFELAIKLQSQGQSPTIISNQSFSSFILFNVPTNESLNTSYTDSDTDGLSDWEELYITYTNPYSEDTDNDGRDDYTENTSYSDPNDFSSYNRTPAVSSLSPEDGAVSISLTEGTISFNISDYEGNNMNYTVTTSPHIGSDSGTTVVNSSQEFSISPLAHATTYYWTINLTDNISWYNDTYSFTTISASENQPNSPVSPLPADASDNISVDYGALSCSVSDPDEDSLNATFYWGDDTLIGTDLSVSSGSRASVSISTLTHNTEYEWYVNVTDGIYVVKSTVWNFTTVSTDVEITMTPSLYDYGIVEFDASIYSSLISMDNTGLINVDGISVIATSFNNIHDTFSWDIGSVAGTDIASLLLYDQTAQAFTTITSSGYTNIPSSTVAVGSSEYYKLYLSMPMLSTYRDTMYGTVTFKYTAGSISRELEFDLTVKAPNAYYNITSNEFSIGNDQFIPGGISEADTYYLSVINNLSVNTTFSLPETYTGKNWVFLTATKDIQTFKVYGITDDFEFEAVPVDGDFESFKLDIASIDLYYSYVVVPNPGYFSASSWWFNLLNDPKTKYMTGENLVIYGV